VNAIAPIATETGGKAWRQTIFYPYLHALRYGCGKALKPILDCEKYDSRNHQDVPYIAAAALWNEEKEEVVLFVVNRSLSDTVRLEVDLRSFGEVSFTGHTVLQSDDLKAVNTVDRETVFPKEKNECESENGICKIMLSKKSWNVVRFSAMIR
jgi:alpha-N-arabinofuranosidase